jgi:hypothetical protein
MDPKDPLKYDFALFGIGRYEGWKRKIPVGRPPELSWKALGEDQ